MSQAFIYKLCRIHYRSEVEKDIQQRRKDIFHILVKHIHAGYKECQADYKQGLKRHQHGKPEDCFHNRRAMHKELVKK